MCIISEMEGGRKNSHPANETFSNNIVVIVIAFPLVHILSLSLDTKRFLGFVSREREREKNFKFFYFYLVSRTRSTAKSFQAVSPVPLIAIAQLGG